MAKNILFDATGARHTYESLWDVALVHASDLIKNRFFSKPSVSVACVNVLQSSSMFDIIKKAPQKVVYYDENVYAGPLGSFFFDLFGLQIRP